MKFTTKDGKVWCLHAQTVQLTPWQNRTNYYFAKVEGGNTCDLPDGYRVVETKNGMPVLQRIPFE